MAVSIRETERMIEAWINGKRYHTSNLHTDGCDIFSYALPLLVRESVPGSHPAQFTYWILDAKPSRSVTTSQHWNRFTSTLSMYSYWNVTTPDGSMVHKMINRGWDTYKYRQIHVSGMP